MITVDEIHSAPSDELSLLKGALNPLIQAERSRQITAKSPLERI